MTAALATQVDDRRNMLAKLHIAKKQLGLDEDTYRANLTRLTGKSSSKDMTQGELEACLKDFSKKGFKAVSTGFKSGLPSTAKITALWLSGWNLGVIRDPSPRAMEAFIQRQTGIAKAQWLINAADATKVIDGLKAWLSREAEVNWKVEKHVPILFNMPQFQVCLAQWVSLRKLGAVFTRHTWTGSPTKASKDLFHYAKAVCGQDVDQMAARDWVTVQGALGKKLRKALEGK
jgi:phage gp16-like protein